MVAKLVGKLSSHRRNRIALYVRETNLPAQLFYRVQGFRATEVVREHYLDTGEDAYLMQYHLDESMIEDRRRTDQPDRQAVRELTAALRNRTARTELLTRLRPANRPTRPFAERRRVSFRVVQSPPGLNAGSCVYRFLSNLVC